MWREIKECWRHFVVDVREYGFRQTVCMHAVCWLVDFGRLTSEDIQTLAESMADTEALFDTKEIHIDDGASALKFLADEGQRCDAKEPN